MASYFGAWLDDIMYNLSTAVRRRRKRKLGDEKHYVRHVEDGFETRSRFVVAKWDFVIPDDIWIGDYHYLKGKRFFSLQEIRDLIECGGLPEGWHVPTNREWRLLLADFDGDFKFMAECLCMNVSGYIPTNAELETYNKAPETSYGVRWDQCFRVAKPEDKRMMGAVYFRQHAVPDFGLLNTQGGYCIRLFKD